MSTTLDERRISDLGDRILRPGDGGYDDARAIHNGLVDQRPAVIVRCRSADDVVAALALARDAGLEVSVRGGGHNVAGRAVADGGVMIDLAEMKAIAVDPERGTVTRRRRRALERAQRRHRRARARGHRRRRSRPPASPASRSAAASAG